MLYNSFVAALTISSGIVSTLYLSAKLDNKREFQYVPLFATCISIATNYVAKETPNFLYNTIANEAIVFTAVACLLTSKLFSSLRFIQAILRLAAASEYPLQTMEEIDENSEEEIVAEETNEEDSAEETSVEEIRAEEHVAEEINEGDSGEENAEGTRAEETSPLIASTEETNKVVETQIQ